MPQRYQFSATSVSTSTPTSTPSPTPATVINSSSSTIQASTVLFFILAVLICLGFVRFGIQKYCNHKVDSYTALKNKMHFGTDALNELKGELQIDLEKGKSVDCLERLKEINDKVAIAIDQHGDVGANLTSLQSKIQTALAQADDPNASSGTCIKQMDFLHDQLTQDKSWYEKLTGSQKFRWILFAVVTFVAYAFILYQSLIGNSDNASEDQKQAALWLNSEAGGYNEIRGDTSSPSLYSWSDPAEIAIFVTLIISAIAFFGWAIWLWRNAGENIRVTQIIMWFMLWTHVCLFLYMIPVNEFHKRFLYNARSYMASALSDSGKELFLAFIVIVLLPIPEANPNASFTTRMSWLMLKLGLFYIIQNILLGSPRYVVEDYQNEQISGVTNSDKIYYGITFAIILILYFMSVKWTCSK